MQFVVFVKLTMMPIFSKKIFDYLLMIYKSFNKSFNFINFLHYISTFSTVYTILTYCTVWDNFTDMVSANQYAVIFVCILLIIQERVYM